MSVKVSLVKLLSTKQFYPQRLVKLEPWKPYLKTVQSPILLTQMDGQLFIMPVMKVIASLLKSWLKDRPTLTHFQTLERPHFIWLLWETTQTVSNYCYSLQRTSQRARKQRWNLLMMQAALLYTWLVKRVVRMPLICYLFSEQTLMRLTIVNGQLFITQLITAGPKLRKNSWLGPLIRILSFVTLETVRTRQPLISAKTLKPSLASELFGRLPKRETSIWFAS